MSTLPQEALTEICNTVAEQVRIELHDILRRMDRKLNKLVRDEKLKTIHESELYARLGLKPTKEDGTPNRKSLQNKCAHDRASIRCVDRVNKLYSLDDLLLYEERQKAKFQRGYKS